MLSVQLSPRGNKPNTNDNMILLRLNSTAIYESKEIADHFNLIFNQLIKMGFAPRIINNCYRLHRFLTLTDALELLIKEKNKYVHKFIKKEDSESNICDLCEEVLENHIEYLDRNSLLVRESSQIMDLKVNKQITQNFLSKLTKVEDRVISQLSSYKDVELPIIKTNLPSLKQKQCEICMNSFDYESMDYLFKLNCNHVYCETCICYYLEGEIINGRVKKIVCPLGKCNDELPNIKIENIIKNYKIELLEKYKKFFNLKKLEDDPAVIFCSYRDCDGHALYVNHHVRIPVKLTCQYNHDICSRCGEQWHEQKLCEKLQEEEIEKLVLTKQLKLKRCPGCRAWVEKNEGCNHITCSVCKFQWCWICNGKFSEHHYNVPGTSCYQKQFPVNGENEWVDYDPNAVERAAQGYIEPAVAEYVPPPVADVVLIMAEPINHTKLSYLANFSYSYSVKGEPRSPKDCITHVLLDIVMFALISIFNFAGNPFLLIALWKNDQWINGGNLFNLRGRFNSKLITFTYYTCFLILWTMYFVSILGTSICAFVLNILNSFIHNCRKGCFTLHI